MGKTLFEKIWDDHLIEAAPGDAGLLYIDRVFLHERTGAIALQSLAEEGRSVHCPEQVFCTMDHIVDTFPGRGDRTRMPGGEAFIQTTRNSSHAAGINLFDIHDPRQGIVHVVSPEQGIVQPGCTLVCPDSHTCSQGALGALAWGIGSSEAEHALATKTLLINRPRTMRVTFEGEVGFGVGAKDLILHLIASHSAAGGAGYAIEFAGAAVTALDIEARLTLCNMAVEFSAFTGLVAPDEKTFRFLQGRPYAPRGAAWEQALAHWRTLRSDADARFDREITIDCTGVAPTVTWGTSPQQACPVNGVVPAPATTGDSQAAKSAQRALVYMDLQPGTRLTDIPIDAAFIGSCTNSRLSDLRAAAAVLRGRRVAAGVKAICVPGSSQVKRAAEAEGLDRVFTDAGFEWRESGCSMCFYAGGESFGYRERVISSTNRNFESRQGPETRTHLASPTTVAASAVAGRIADVREFAA
ncbi:3-isopropylmalate dehydratase large subunit [Exilibacterium tricleocarpae]|uniref:3-isopropylmalate dehydratase n=1 Tax=Exilibacterium tricleocarpae TaxID=2591008 RepID=A0A545TVJ8_9GAMM|nr:3-isopropylmalate dehydratase large subunit [Exilibacterium tricleocarpae]TQV81250.1 3-isopropylmalate dehydratase large subunit [Exilibacterium tricleocarpae]